MEAYRPAPPPLWKRSLGNPFFHLAVILLLTLMIVYFIRSQQNANMFAAKSSNQAGPLIVERRETPVTDVPMPARNNPEPAPPPQMAMAVNRPPETTADPSKNSRLTARIIYAEVDRNVLENLKQESASTGQYTDFGDFRAGSLNEIGKRILSERGINILQRIEKTFDANSQTQQWFVGHKYEGDIEIGFNSSLSLRPNSDGTLHGELEVIRSLRESRDGMPVKRAYPINSFDISPGSGWMMNLSLPRQFEQDDGQDLSPEGVNRLFRSARFKGGLSELTIFVEIEHRAGTP